MRNSRGNKPNQSSTVTESGGGIVHWPSISSHNELGIIGFFARRHGFAVAPIAVGLILGEMVEVNLQNSLKMFEGDWWMIMLQPLAAFFLILAFLGLCGPYLFGKLMNRGSP